MAEKNKRGDQGMDRQFSQKRAIINSLKAVSENVLFNSGGLAIKTVSSAIVKTVNTVYAYCDGKLVKKAAADMAALSGTVTNAKHNVFVFSMTNAGTLKTRMGTEGASLGAVVPPIVPNDEVVIGMVYVNPTGTGNFVGGTTALDDGTVTPNAVYIDTVGNFHPNQHGPDADRITTES